MSETPADADGKVDVIAELEAALPEAAATSVAQANLRALADATRTMSPAVVSALHTLKAIDGLLAFLPVSAVVRSALQGALNGIFTELGI